MLRKSKDYDLRVNDNGHVLLVGRGKSKDLIHGYVCVSHYPPKYPCEPQTITKEGE